MRVYFVQPPKGIEYKASALAQLDFEEGKTYREVGYADYEGGQFVNRHKYSEARPVRYSEKDEVFGLIWKPGRIVFLKFKVPAIKHTVSPELGRQHGESMVKHRETKSFEKFRKVEEVRRDKAVLDYQVRETGGWWITSNGFKVRPFYLNECLHLIRFPYLVWGDQMDQKFGSGAADREIQRWYWAAMHALYNPYAKKMERSVSGAINNADGNSRTMPAPNPDHVGGVGKDLMHDLSGPGFNPGPLYGNSGKDLNSFK